MTRRPAPPKKPYDPPRGKYVRLKFSDLVKIVAMIEQHGQSKKLMGRSSAINTSVRLSSDAAKAVKELVAAHPVMSNYVSRQARPLRSPDESRRDRGRRGG
jgi:hypothetical protein